MGKLRNSFEETLRPPRSRYVHIAFIQLHPSPRRGHGPSSSEISVDPMTTSRRTFLRIAAGRRRRQLASRLAAAPPDPSRAAAEAAVAAAKGGATYWFLTGAPGEGIRTNTVKRFNDANPKTQIKATTFQNDAYKTKIKTAIGAGQAPDDHLGLGRRRAEELRRREPGRGPHRLVRARTRRSRTGCSPSSFGAATVDGKIYALPTETVQPIVLYYNKTDLREGRRPDPRSRGATSWPWCRSSTPRASRRSPSAASRAGPT